MKRPIIALTLLILFVFVPLFSTSQEIGFADLYGRWKNIKDKTDYLGFESDTTMQMYNSDTAKTGMLRNKIPFRIFQENSKNFLIVFKPKKNTIDTSKMEITLIHDTLVVIPIQGEKNTQYLTKTVYVKTK